MKCFIYVDDIIFDLFQEKLIHFSVNFLILTDTEEFETSKKVIGKKKIVKAQETFRSTLALKFLIYIKNK